MSEPTITQEAVAAAAASLLAQGKKPTLKAVRQALRTSCSQSTLVRSMTKWRQDHQDQNKPDATVSPEVAAAFQREIDRHISAALIVLQEEIELIRLEREQEAAEFDIHAAQLEDERKKNRELEHLVIEKDILIKMLQYDDKKLSNKIENLVNKLAQEQAQAQLDRQLRIEVEAQASAAESRVQQLVDRLLADRSPSIHALPQERAST